MERVSDFITLTRSGGQSVLVNVNQVALVRHAKLKTGDTEENTIVIQMESGLEFEVTESWGDVAQLLVPPEMSVS